MCSTDGYRLRGEVRKKISLPLTTDSTAHIQPYVVSKCQIQSSLGSSCRRWRAREFMPVIAQHLTERWKWNRALRTKRNRGSVWLGIKFRTVLRDCGLSERWEGRGTTNETKGTGAVSGSPSCSQGGLVRCWSPSMPVISAGWMIERYTDTRHFRI